jgi:hypothetical protein
MTSRSEFPTIQVLHDFLVSLLSFRIRDGQGQWMSPESETFLKKGQLATGSSNSRALFKYRGVSLISERLKGRLQSGV